MVSAMNPTPSYTKKVSLKSFRKKKLENVVILKSAALFELMVLPYGFLRVDPVMWEERDAFKTLKVVNDHGERGFGIGEFSGPLTKSEPELQFLLQVVEEHYADSRNHINRTKWTVRNKFRAHNTF